MTINTNIDEKKIIDRAYQIISEIVPYIQDVGLKDQNQPIINDLSGYLEECFFPFCQK